MLSVVCISICYFRFFCFTQKTAYERRISDWSSDVCSSDLLPVYAADLPLVQEGQTVTIEGSNGQAGQGRIIFAGPTIDPQTGAARTVASLQNSNGDRKSDAEEKSVSVRVERGGGRHIKTSNIRN